jgi:broad specificity phosphatase PhoE
MKIYFARHGESEANLIREFSNTGRKHPLTDKGRQQAAQLAESLLDAGVVHIYASPLLRSEETAQILAQRLGVDFTITDALREFDTGIYEGTRDPKGWEAHKQVGDAWMRGEWDQRMQGGESLLDLRARFMPFIRDLIRQYKDQSGSLVLVSHGGLYCSILPLALENVSPVYAHGHGMGNTAYVLAEIRGDGLVCVEWAGKKYPFSVM